MRVRFGDFVLDTDRRELTRGGVAVALRPKALQLLETLVESRPKAMSQEELYERLWPDTFVDKNSLREIIHQLRDALGDEEFDLHEGENLVGRERDATVRIDAPSISRHHARIVVAGGQASIEDLQSKNGTFVRGARASKSSRDASGRV